MEFLPRRADVGNDVGNVSQHRCEQHQREHHLEENKQVFSNSLRPRGIPQGSQGQSTPIERVQVLNHHFILILWEFPDVGGPVGAGGHYVVEAGVPVKQRQKVVQEGQGANQVGVVGVALGAVLERPEAIHLDESKAAED